MRVIVCGGRFYNDANRMFVLLDHFRAAYGISVVIHGAAKGADSLADQWAKSRGIPVIAKPAQWDKFGKSAGFKRNWQMLHDQGAEYVIAFDGGTGTKNMVDIANKAGVPVADFRLTK